MLPEAPPRRALGDQSSRGAQLSQLCVRCRALFVGFARHRRQHADEVEVLSRTCERLGALIDHFVGKASLLSADNDRRDPWRTAALPAPAGLKVWLEQRQP